MALNLSQMISCYNSFVKTFIAVDVGGTKIRVAVYGEEGVTPLNHTRISTRGARGTTLDRLIEAIQSLWPQSDPVSAIGIAAPGPIDPHLGVIYAAPNVPGWVNLPLVQILRDRFKVPTFLGNDANLAALAEWRYGAGRGHHDLLYLTISTGIGGGVISGDRLLLGQCGLAAELGHVVILPDGPLCGCGKRGHLEALASGTAIARYVAEELANGRPSSLRGTQTPTAREISQAADAGDSLAVEAYTLAGRYLGMGIASFLHIFNPSIVILGGGVSHSGPQFYNTMQDEIRQNVMSPAYLNNLTITYAELKDDSVLLGALALARSARE